MSSFSLFQNPIRLAHSYWKKVLNPGDVVMDATCGNGYDTLALSKLVLTSTKGKVLACDLQEKAIIQAQQLLKSDLNELFFAKVEWFCGCHSTLPKHWLNLPIKLVVYNLGYLPGGDKAITTRVETTWQSIKLALGILTPGGLISITCYPGHPEGLLEEEFLLKSLQSMENKLWSICHHRWINRKQAPSLIMIEKQNIH